MPNSLSLLCPPLPVAPHILLALRLAYALTSLGHDISITDGWGLWGSRPITKSLSLSS